MHPAIRLSTLAASLALSGTLLAQQPGPPPAPPAGGGNVHHTTTRSRDRHRERYDEMRDLDQLGLPVGDFWQNPRVVKELNLTPDQVKRLADSNLEGRLKLIHLDADLQTEQLKRDTLFDTDSFDAAAGLAEADRVADDRAAVEKADAEMAFNLRAVLTPEQLGKLRSMRPHNAAGAHHPGQSTPTQPPAPPPPPAQ